MEFEGIESGDILESMDKNELLKILKKMLSGGISVMFHGKKTASEIRRKVRPRIMKQEGDLSVGSEQEAAGNMLIEGENLQAMVTLYKYKGLVDLIVTDPPYNTGQYFRYNDKWDEDPNDPDLGGVVTLEDGSRHTKWMKFMLPRIQMMKEMLKPGGVLAICIDHNELFHLGMMLDEIFGEENRIGLINWQKSYSPKNDSKHLSSATEYVLIYARDRERATTNLLDRDETMNRRYTNKDNDSYSKWAGGDPTASRVTDKDRYAIQSPFTGTLHYPGAGSWRNKKSEMKKWLGQWGTEYCEKDLKDGRAKALVMKKAPLPNIGVNVNLDENSVIEDQNIFDSDFIQNSREKAKKIRNTNTWPRLFFLKEGYGRPRLKRYLIDVKQGKVPMTYWANDEYEGSFELGTQSWAYTESGHSQVGINELNNLVGKGNKFQTVKPLKLIKKIIQLWCPNDGLVLDPFAGSGTTGHAVLELNYEVKSDRNFILIEQGSPQNGDKYARTLTCDRLKRAIKGEWVTNKKDCCCEAIGGGFKFYKILNKIDANAILSMKRDDLIDVVLSSHNDIKMRRNSIYEIKGKYQYLVAKNSNNEGIFIIWDGPESVGELDINAYREIIREAREENLCTKYSIYARYETYQSKNVVFYKIPDKVLAHLGLNEYTDKYNEEEVLV
ncbi:site-specific DNA-methyltransferase [Clostridium sp. DL1XJH146]